MVIEDTHTRTRTHIDARVDGYTLTVEDAAAQLGKSVESVRRYIRTGKLHAVRVEGKNTNEYRINLDDLGAIYAHTQSHTHTTTHAGDRTPIDVSVNAPTEAIQALMQAITAQLEAQYQARLSGKDDLIAGKDELIRELRRRADVAEHELTRMQRARRTLAWWLRLFMR